MFSLVIPVYKNEASLPSLVGELERLTTLLDHPLEVVFVVDGCPEGSFAWLRENLAQKPFRSKLCLHSRNFGSFAAIRTGLGLATGPYFAVMAADLQEPITLAAEFFGALAKDEADIVIGQRLGRADPAPSRVFSDIFWLAYRKLIFAEMPEGGVDVFGCNEACRNELLALEEHHSSLVGLLFFIGFRRKLIGYERKAREHGESAWTFRRKVTYLLDSVYSFSDLPIRILKWFGVFALVLSFIFSVVALYEKLSGQVPVSGYTALMLTIVFFGGLNAFGLGVIGEYVWRSFENTKGRPLAIVRTRMDFEARS
jgi:polyisoprenyl-phosphate glycosyltransferase